MKITIYKLNNKLNDEQICTYEESRLINNSVQLNDNFSFAPSSHKLIVKSQAVREILDFIEWDIGERRDNRVEQGGILIGNRFFDAEQDIHYAVVTKALTADNAIGSATHLNITPDCWNTLHEEKDAYNLETGQENVIIGWFHTHPNRLSCFMSGTDRDTQKRFFPGENTYSIVINPQRHLMKAFRSKECFATQAFFLFED